MAGKGLTDIAGLRVGHASDLDGITGCTVILCGPQGAVAGVDVRGSAVGEREMETLRVGHLVERIHALVLAGGSAFGLEAAGGAVRYLEEQGIGFDTGVAKVPIVPAAILFDLGIGDSRRRPDSAMGYQAAQRASDAAVEEGSVGAGTGATVGKLFGSKQATKGGLGTATQELPGGVAVSALAVVNAFGDVRDPATGAIIAGARTAPDSPAFADTVAQMKQGVLRRSNGLARALSPVHTTFDGDVVFSLSLGRKEADLNTVGTVAAEVVAEAIVRGVKRARGLGGVPALKELAGKD
jgi:L-aminopeptidase/D-esterase-like protein